MADLNKPVCIGCGKSPGDIEEYADEALLKRISPERYVKEFESTYNVNNGHFACSQCYMKMGAPIGPAYKPWKAP